MEPFCNGEPFWDNEKTWNNTWPRFTSCFQSTVLVWVPCAWLWLTAPFYIYYLCTVSPQVLSSVAKYLVKLLGCALLLLLSIVDIVQSVSDHRTKGSNTYFLADVVAPSVQSLTFLLALLFIFLERRKGLITSGVLFLFWVFQIVAGIVPFYSKIKLQTYQQDVLRFSLFYIYYFLVLVEFGFSCFAETAWNPPSQKIRCPETESSFLSRITFWWSNRLLFQGYKKALTEDDVSDLHPREKSINVVPRFLVNWNYEVEKAREKARRQGRQSDPLASGSSSSQDSNEYTPLIPKQAPAEEAKSDKTGPLPSLVLALWKTFGLELLQSQFWKLLYDALLLCNPLLLGQLIEFVENNQTEEWKGYTFGAILFASMSLQSVFFHALWHQSTSLGLRVRASIISAVFRKALSINNQARRESTVGEIVNLMSVDAEHVEGVFGWLWSTWSSLLQICVSLYLLYNTLGVAMFAGLGFLLLLFPLNGIIMTKLGKYQTQLMEQKDIRMKMVNEVLSGMKILKLYAWEDSYKEKVKEVRDRELAILLKSSLISSSLTFSWTVAPYMVSLVTFLTYIYITEDHYLNPQTAFVAISLFNILRFAVNMLPMVLTDVVKAVISVRRISKYLSRDDLDESSTGFDPLQDEAIVIRNATFSWTTEMEPTLKGINLKIKDGHLLAVVGQVGSGKSSLVSAILGELNKVKGKVSTRGRIAYVPQQAWIQNDTLQNNILFGKRMDRHLYDEVVECCALKADLDMLPAGDLTEIGERGINLSGGQKQRVSLARAVYNDADIYLLDDPLSAVDSHVGKHIFDKVICKNGLLKNKTRVLVTHGIHWLLEVDTVVVMTNGLISEIGSYDELLSHNGPFAQFLRTYFLESEDEDGEDPEVVEMKRQVLQRLESVKTDDEVESDIMEMRRKKRESECKGADEDPKAKDEEEDKEDKKKLIEEEKVEGGRVKWNVFMTFGRAVGLKYVGLIFTLYGLYEAAAVIGNVWLSEWTDDAQLNDMTALPYNSTERLDRNNYYLGIYGALGAAQTIFVMGFSITVSIRSVHASRILHTRMLANVFKAPMSYFDTTPAGRIVNRFSQDIDTVDNELPLTFEMWIDTALLVLGTIIVISYSTPIFLAVIVPLFILYVFIQRFYIPTSRQVKRLESKTRSPIYSHFGETVSGASVIRAYGVADRFIEESEKRVDNNQRFAFAGFTANRWLGIRLEFLGNFIILAASVFAVLARDSITGGLVGLSISYALEITGNLNWLVRMTSDLETQVVSVERIKEYTEIASEAPWSLQEHCPNHDWPQSGVVKFVDYSTRYRQGLDLVLRGISCTINSGEKVGIVGRTGAGKSSLTLSLFRLIEAAGGQIIIDGVDVSTLGLHDLRKRLTILPQDPVLFAGTLRINLDPFNKHSDGQIWTALDHAHLKTFVQSLPDKLQHECGEGGENLSVGQRQLLCLARALLKKTKILVLDEATAAVDMETDDLIQQTIRSEFKNCTVLTIAHRLNTVMDYDRILVLDNGKVVDFDSPQSLLQQPGGVFYRMAEDAGLA
ncbi:multidrug resistance-associated protein 1-like [Haliotis rufescens]|uniref:multidrug resistance-associated protein 1-like n=1 Tax=Haliotis rufescens TaxID=6454 RepID=UPI00201F1E90|nr:multidrug resistance-associated protein 1-like [Haliotis rufescens]